jgi:hypothetical protein
MSKVLSANALSKKRTLGVIMPKNVDVLDETVIDSPPLVVYKAILNEFAGTTH